MENSLTNSEYYEYKLSNKFIIQIDDIPSNLFINYKIFNIGEDLIFKTKFIETIDYIFNPKDFFKIDNITLKILDASGKPHTTIYFNVKGSNYKKCGSYRNSNLLYNKFRFIIDSNTIKINKESAS